MAYARYSRDCSWYIFWADSTATSRQEERLAVWHADHRDSGSEFPYEAVQDMVRRSDFTGVPGRRAEDDERLREAFSEFLRDVERAWG